MIRKPWPIIVVALIFGLIPIFNLVMNYFLLDQEASVTLYLSSLLFLPENRLVLFDLIAPGIICAFAVYQVRPWSFPVLFISFTWLIVRAFLTFPENGGAWEFFIRVFPFLINGAFASVVLLPQTRVFFYNQRMRWWENKPRYKIETPVTVSFEGKEQQGKTANVSEGGVMILTSAPLSVGSSLSLSLTVLDNTFDLKGLVVYHLANTECYGVQYVDLSKEQRSLLKKTARDLEKNNFEKTRQAPPLKEDFLLWLKSFKRKPEKIN